MKAKLIMVIGIDTSVFDCKLSLDKFGEILREKERDIKRESLID